jgi:hypothetical protein
MNSQLMFRMGEGARTIKPNLALSIGAFVTFIWHGGWECCVGLVMDFEEK